MRKIKRILAVIMLMAASLLFTGCREKEEILSTISEVKEIPPLPYFTQKPDRTVREVELPETYDYMQDGRMPALLHGTGQ